MKKIFKKKKIFLLFLGLIIIAVLGYFNVSKYNLPAQAELYDIGPPLEGDNLSGFAWSSNIGWISFNSSDCDTDGDGTFEGAGEFGGAAPAGCPTSGVAEDYGVHVAMDTGDLKGYAWSENIVDWQRLPEPVLRNDAPQELRGPEDPRIVKLDGRFYMTYTGFGGRFPGDYRICLAISDDLKHWERQGVVLDEENITKLPMHQRAQKGISYLPQQDSIFRKLSVENNIMAILEMRSELG